MKKNNMLPRICKACGTTFLGGPRAWYCPPCRDERQKKQNAEFKRRKRAGQVIPLGSVIRCEICGREIIKSNGLMRFCDECAAEQLKKIDNQQSKEWNRSNPETYKAAKKEFSKKRYADGETKPQPRPGVIWDKERKKWAAQIYVNRRQYKILRTDDIILAIKARQEADELNKAGKLTPEETFRLREKYKNYE